MDTLERIEREFDIRAELLDNKLRMERAERKLLKRIEKEERIKDLVRQAVIVVGIALSLFLLYFGITLREPKFHSSDWNIDVYVVESGDTLWSIGEEVTNGTVDLRVWVYEVKMLNGMESSDIYPRDVIRIYVPKEVK